MPTSLKVFGQFAKTIIDSENHRMAEVGSNWSSLPAQAGPLFKLSQLPRKSRWLHNNCKDGDSTTSLSNLWQCSVTLTVKTCFLVFRLDLLCFILNPLSLVLSQGTTEKSLAPFPSFPPIRCLDTRRRFLWPFSSPDWTVSVLSAFPHVSDAPVS